MYLVACLAGLAWQWMRQQCISCMRVKCIFRGLFGLAVGERMWNK